MAQLTKGEIIQKGVEFSKNLKTDSEAYKSGAGFGFSCGYEQALLDKVSESIPAKYDYTNDIEKLYEWVILEPRPRAITYFSSGVIRLIAAQVEQILWSGYNTADLSSQDKINLDQWVEFYENLRQKNNMTDSIKILVQKIVEYNNIQRAAPAQENWKEKWHRMVSEIQNEMDKFDDQNKGKAQRAALELSSMVFD